MQHSTTVLRSAITALSALFLVAGVAFAASAFVGGNGGQDRGGDH